MKKSTVCYFIALAMFAGYVLSGCMCSNAQKEDKNQDKMIDQIVASMTLKEKAQLVIGTGMFFELPDSLKAKFGQKAIDPKDSAYTAMVEKIRKYVPGAAGNSAMFEKLGVTSQVLCDGPAGLRIKPTRKGETQTYYCTAFPIATLLASSWDTALVSKVGKAMGNEVLEYGADVLLGPGMNLQRDPLCGRNFEYYSEDPLITGKMAAAMVKGVQSNGVGTSIKHFAANNQETNRLTVNTMMSKRALRELYLRGFEIAVKEAQPWTVMSSYNKINNVYASESYDLLTKILRNDWNFRGYVMTDWGGGSDLVAQMNAGNDMIQPGSPEQVYSLIKAVEDKKLDINVLNTNVKRILKIMLETPKYKKYAYTSKPDLKAHAEVTRQAAAEGMVLLENKANALPISPSAKKVAAFGNTSYDFIAGGTGSGDVNEAYTISLIEGLKNAGFATNAQLMDVYAKYMTETRAKMPKSNNWLTAMMGGKVPVPEMAVTAQLAAQMAAENDVALITIGRNSGEGSDREAKDGDFYLNKNEKDLIANVTKAFNAAGKKAIVILNVGGVIETASWKTIPDAVLLAWQGGQEGGNSVMDVLTGKVNPSGKLAISFPVSYTDVPSAKNFPGVAEKSDVKDDKADVSGFSFMKRVPWEVTYEEDIFVGYRYYNTFKVPVSYPFGYGLSYTNFEYSNLKLSATEFKDKLSVSVTVKNNGKTAGREVVELYLKAPAAKMEKPEQELRGFGKTKLLKAGESETLTFEINPRDLCSFDENGNAWIAEAGDYTVRIAASATATKLEGKFKLANDLTVEKVSNSLNPTRQINKLHVSK